MSAQWQKLPTRNISTPPLLHRFVYTSQSYEFILTDLTFIWQENLQHRGILARAEETATSIDPSEDNNQYNVFMRKIQDALNAASKTSVVVTTGQKSDSLVVTTKTGLPGGLKPLKWSFQLLKQRPVAVTQHLIYPLLKSEKDHARREQILLEHIKEKDNVLSKIFDKIESSQLASLFPAAAGVRHTKLRTPELIKHIKGATRFDEQELIGDLGTEVVTDDLVECVSYFDECFTSGSTRNAGAAWWTSLESREDSESSSAERPARTKNRATASESDTARLERNLANEDISTEDEDDFQRQETPPHLKKKTDVQGKSPPKHNQDSEIESDQETKSGDGSDLEKAANSRVKPAKKAFGRIGGPKPTVVEHVQDDSTESDGVTEEFSSEKNPAVGREKSALNNDTDSDIEPGRQSSRESPEINKSSPARKVTKKKGVLGKIGGKTSENKELSRDAAEDKNAEQDSSDDRDGLRSRSTQSKTTTTGTPKKGKKLGLIGGKKSQVAARAKDTSEPNDDTEDDLDIGQAQRGVLASPSPPRLPSKSLFPIPNRARKIEPEENLSAEQKADKKREELKRQLDAKSKAPGKKKRKF